MGTFLDGLLLGVAVLLLLASEVREADADAAAPALAHREGAELRQILHRSVDQETQPRGERREQQHPVPLVLLGEHLQLLQGQVNKLVLMFGQINAVNAGNRQREERVFFAALSGRAAV